MVATRERLESLRVRVIPSLEARGFVGFRLSQVALRGLPRGVCFMRVLCGGYGIARVLGISVLARSHQRLRRIRALFNTAAEVRFRSCCRRTQRGKSLVPLGHVRILPLLLGSPALRFCVHAKKMESVSPHNSATSIVLIQFRDPNLLFRSLAG